MGGWTLHVFLMNTFNADPGTFTIVPQAVLAQVLIALLAPAFASLIPIFSGVRITIREAISTYGLGTGSGLLDRLLAKRERMPRLLLLTISNTFRNKGRVALSGVLSLNVLERTREIGVMRAIGASSGTITRLFMGEGFILGWLSWLIAVPLSIPAGRLMTQALGTAIQTNLVYVYRPTGAIYWLVIITGLSIAASWFPARRATRISVRESLTYQ